MPDQIHEQTARQQARAGANADLDSIPCRAGLDPQGTAGVSRMWYRRSFTVPAAWEAAGTHATLLNFGAVDWEAVVWVNGIHLGQHRGGFVFPPAACSRAHSSSSCTCPAFALHACQCLH